MIKYMAYRLFLKAMDKERNIFISGNSKKSMEIIDCLRCYRMDKVYFNWQDKNNFNIVIHYDSRVKLEHGVIENNTLYIFVGDDTGTEDMAYTLLSCYYLARRKNNDSYRSIMCV